MNGDTGQMARQPLDEAGLDSLIDAVAREMTAGEPSGALRARVLDDVRLKRHRPSPAMPRRAWVPAAAVLLAAATGLWFMSRPSGPPEEAGRVTASLPSTTPRTSEATPPAAALQAAREESRPAVQVSRSTPARPLRRVETDASEDRNPVPALAEISPLRFAAVEPAPLRIDAVVIEPFPAIRTIEIPSLDPGSTDSQSAVPNKEK